jgi:hypothetical protein
MEVSDVRGHERGRWTSLPNLSADADSVDDHSIRVSAFLSVRPARTAGTTGAAAGATAHILATPGRVAVPDRGEEIMVMGLAHLGDAMVDAITTTARPCAQ